MSIAVEPVTGTIGAEIHGVDPSQPLDDSTVDELRKAWLDHLVLFFRDVDLTPDEQIRFASSFGEPDPPKMRTAHGGPPEMNVLDQTNPKGDGADNWHTDSTYAAIPPMGSVMRVVKAPSVGGDTCFANMYLAYEGLSSRMQRHIDGLEAEHEIISQLVKANARGHTQFDLDEARKAFPPVRHPVVCTHPETGRKYLYVNSNHTDHIVDIPRAESDSLLAYLYDQVKQVDIQCRFKWDEHSLVLCDNRSTQHCAVADYHERRILHRVSLKGERPR